MISLLYAFAAGVATLVGVHLVILDAPGIGAVVGILACMLAGYSISERMLERERERVRVRLL